MPLNNTIHPAPLPARQASGAPASRLSALLRQIVLLGILLLTLIWIAVAWEARRVQEERLADFRQNLSHLAEVLDETLARQLHEIDNALLILRHQYIRDKRSVMDLAELLREGPFKNLDAHVTVIGADGYSEISNVPGSHAKVYLGDRPNFRVFADGGPDQLYISEPALGRLTQRWGIQLARPILGENGKFLGVAVLFLAPEQLTRFFQSLEIGVDTVMTIASTNGVVISRSESLPQLLGSSIAAEQMAQYRGQARGFSLRRSQLDQIERGLAHRWLKDYPLLLVVSRTPAAVYAEIQSSRYLLVSLGAGTSLIGLVILFMLGKAVRQRERAQAQRQAEHLHLLEAQRLTQLGSWELDIASGQLSWSDQVFRIFEIDPDQFSASYDAFLKAVHPDDRDSVRQTYADSLDKHQPYNIVHRLRMPDGRIKWVRERCTTEFDASGQAIRSTGTVQDISTYHQNEIELRIAAIAFESQEGMFVTDEQGVIVRINSAFTDITGYTAADAIGQNPRFRSSGRHDKAFYADLWKQVKRLGYWKGEIWNRRKSGEIHPESVTITAVQGDDAIVTHYVATLHDITERKAAEEQIQSLAFFDPLTRLPNRRLLQDRLQQALVARARHHQHGALLFLDLDQFKTLNDTLGHDIGDLLLQQVGQRLQGCVREADTVARLGGDEFVVLLEKLSEQRQEAQAQAERVGQKILAALNQPYELAGHRHHSTPSIGVTLFSDQTASWDELLKQADLAMYQAKTAGRNTLRFFDPALPASDPAPPPA